MNDRPLRQSLPFMATKKVGQIHAISHAQSISEEAVSSRSHAMLFLWCFLVLKPLVIITFDLLDMPKLASGL